MANLLFCRQHGMARGAMLKLDALEVAGQVARFVNAESCLNERRDPS
jgi:hypothetical protein